MVSRDDRFLKGLASVYKGDQVIRPLGEHHPLELPKAVGDLAEIVKVEL